MFDYKSWGISFVKAVIFAVFLWCAGFFFMQGMLSAVDWSCERVEKSSDE